MSKLNATQMKMLAEVKRRQSENFSFKEFGCGLSIASQYVKGWSDLIGGVKSSYLTGIDINEAIKRSENIFTWCDGDQPDDATKAGKDFFDSGASLKKFKLPEGVEVPKNTLMVFRNVITTNAEDRDGDILHTAGAKIDEPMPLLWQHMSALPIGKMLSVDTHNEKMLRVFSVLLDMNELTEDTAKLIEAKVLRISHGFIPLKFTERETESKDVPWRGFDIKEFEVMEESTVSVPSNRAAVIDMFSRDVFKSPIMQGIGKELFDNRLDKIYPGFSLLNVKNEDSEMDPLENQSTEPIELTDNVEPLDPTSQSDNASEPTSSHDNQHEIVNLDPALINSGGKDKEAEQETNSEFEPVVSMMITETVGNVAKSHVVKGIDAIRNHLEKLELIVVKGGRELSKTNIQLLRDVVDDLVELKSAEGLSRSHVALINKNINALNILIQKSTPEDPIEGEDPLIPDGEQSPEKAISDEAFKSFLIKFLTFDADDDQLKMVGELLATRKEIYDSIQVGSDYRSLVNQ